MPTGVSPGFLFAIASATIEYISLPRVCVKGLLHEMWFDINADWWIWLFHQHQNDKKCTVSWSTIDSTN